MFKCEKCKRSIGPAVSPIVMVTEMRQKVYPQRYKDGVMVDLGGHGQEIVKEIKVCESCK